MHICYIVKFNQDIITMIIDSLCPPAVLYLGFSIIQIIIDLFKGQQNSAFLKIVVMIIFTILLNQLCMGGLTILSWFIVFIPFIMMTYVTTILLYVFGLNPSKGNQQPPPDPRSPAVPRPYNFQEMGCAKTQFGCCPNGVTASNMYGSNCQWPQPYVRHGGHHHFLPTSRPSVSPGLSPTAITRPGSTPSPTVTTMPSASLSPSLTVTTMPSAIPGPTRS